MMTTCYKRASHVNLPWYIDQSISLSGSSLSVSFPSSIYINTNPSLAVPTLRALRKPPILQSVRMGLPMAPQEADRHLPQIPTLNLSNGSRIATWMMCQSNQTKSNISINDFTYFNNHGAFFPRSVFTITPIILRLEIHNASNAHLFPTIRRPHFDVHPTSAKTLQDLRTVLVQQVRNYSKF